MLEINKKLKYYKNELANISDIELKTQISQLMSALVQKRVLSSASEFYIVKEMTKPGVAYIKDKAKPKRALIVIVAFITSIILAIFGVFFIEFLKNSKEDQSIERNLYENPRFKTVVFRLPLKALTCPKDV